MPSVKEGESKEDFMDRCMTIVKDEEGKSQGEALGKCLGIWNND